MRLLTALSLTLLLALPARAQIDGDFGPATLVIEYQDGTDLFRKARLTLAPASRDAKPISRGAIDQIGVLSAKGNWIIIDSFLSSGHSSGIQAEALLPAPEAISVILIKPEDGPWQGWKVEEGESYTEVEWTYFNQRGREVQSAPCAPRDCFANVVVDDAGQEYNSESSTLRIALWESRR